MNITVDERIIILSDTSVAGIHTEDYDIEKLVHFLEILKTVPINYDRDKNIPMRTEMEFMQCAGELGFVRYQSIGLRSAEYFSKGWLFEQPILICRTVSDYLPYQNLTMYGETTPEDLIDDFIRKLRDAYERRGV